MRKPNIVSKYRKSKQIYRQQGFETLLKSTANYITNYTRRPRLELQKYQLQLKYGDAAPDPMGILHIDPRNVEYYFYWGNVINDQFRKPIIDTVANIDRTIGTYTVGGDWDRIPDEPKEDRHMYPFEEYYMWRATIEHFEQGVEWEKTAGFKEKNRELESYQQISNIYKKINQRGYKRQRDLKNGYNRWLMPPEYDEVRISIGRDGDLIFGNGRHRFCAARYLGVKSIPVRVIVRHKEWQKLREEVAKSSSVDDLSEKATNHLEHPDMQDVLGDIHRN